VDSLILGVRVLEVWPDLGLLSLDDIVPMGLSIPPDPGSGVLDLPFSVLASRLREKNLEFKNAIGIPYIYTVGKTKKSHYANRLHFFSVRRFCL
jgi:hypothetical protein